MSQRSLSGAAPAIERLLEVRGEHPEAWSTLDAQTTSEVQTIFHEVRGQDKIILELGSGHGFTCLLFGLLGATRVCGMELVPSAVSMAQQVKQQVAPELPVIFVCGDVAKPLPFQDGCFDVLLLVEVVSHVVMEDLLPLFRETARVLRQGAILYISDGNNARSWKRRRENHEIWERFDQGPPTQGDETVYSHRIATPYAETRRTIAITAVPTLSSSEANAIAARTFRLSRAEIEDATRRYVESGALPDSPFQRGLCPIEPLSHTYIEQLIDPVQIRQQLKAAGFELLFFGPRRRLPLHRLWTTFSWLTCLLANGFKIIARRVPAP